MLIAAIIVHLALASYAAMIGVSALMIFKLWRSEDA